jgi:diacylglycerol kinase (ATP)
MNCPPPSTPARPGELRRLIRALGYSLQGLAAAARHEAAFRLELILGMPAMLLAAFLPLPLPARAMLIASVLLILLAELLNSAVECVVDYAAREHHPLAGRAKDMGSAAVFLAMLNAVLVWCLVVAGHWQALSIAFCGS